MSWVTSVNVAEQKLGLHSFKAGKLNRVEGTNRVRPDPRKGLIYLEVSEDLLRFYWKDRTTGAVEDDLIIFPDDAEFVQVKEASGGRVFALKYNSSSLIMFYWMQEKESTDDAANVKRVNDLIADPTSTDAQPSAQSSATSALGDLVSLLGQAGAGNSSEFNSTVESLGLSQELVDAFRRNTRNIDGSSLRAIHTSNVRASIPHGTGADETMTDDIAVTGSIEGQRPSGMHDPIVPSGEVQSSAGQSAISQINNDRPQATHASNSLHSILSGICVPGQEQQEQVDAEPLDLQDVLTPELVLPLLADADVRQQLFPHLPSSLVSDPPTEDEVRSIITSVQWRTALGSLSYALNHGGQSAIRSLGVDASNLQGTSGVEAFIRAVAQSLQDQKHSEDADKMEE